MKKLANLILLISTYTISAQSINIEPSRTSGTAPLYVFFDATSSTGLDNLNDLPNADFSWSFDTGNNDPNGKWEESKGMVAGHVFEIPGIYTVTCTMTARNGVTDTQEITINVSEFSGLTYYVSNNGNDSNDGLSENSTWATASHAISQLSANTRILFNRGDTFTGIDQQIRNLNTGVKIIGAYGAGNNPILINALGNTVIDIDNCNNVVAMDLHLIVDNFTGAGDNRQNRGFRSQESTHTLGLRLEIENAESFATYQDNGDALGIFDCNIHDIGAIGIFSSDSRRFSWVGNSIDGMRTVQPEHCMRIQGGEKQFIAHSTFMNLPDVKTTITLRGNGQKHIMVYKNKTDRIIQIAPTDHNALQFISLATIEGNYIGQNPDYEDTNYAPSLSAINLISTEIVVRNNLFDGIRRGISIYVEHPEIIPGNIDIYNNTMNWRNVMPASGNSGTMVSCSNAVNVNIKNNLMSAPSFEEMIIYGGDDNSNLVESNNLMTLTPGYVIEDLPGTAADENDASNFMLTEDSVAIDKGALNIPVHYDQSGENRYYGSAPDLGAFEYNNGSDFVNPDPSEGNPVLSISKTEIETFKIYPNPATKTLYIKEKHLGYAISIISMNGVVVLKSPSIIDKKLDISHLSNGIYIIKVFGEKLFTSKFIKK